MITLLSQWKQAWIRQNEYERGKHFCQNCKNSIDSLDILVAYVQMHRCLDSLCRQNIQS